MLAKDPADRWPRMVDALAALGAERRWPRTIRSARSWPAGATGGGPVLSDSPTPTSPPPRTRRVAARSAPRPAGGRHLDHAGAGRASRWATASRSSPSSAGQHGTRLPPRAVAVDHGRSRRAAAGRPQRPGHRARAGHGRAHGHLQGGQRAAPGGGGRAQGGRHRDRADARAAAGGGRDPARGHAPRQARLAGVPPGHLGLGRRAHRGGDAERRRSRAARPARSASPQRWTTPARASSFRCCPRGWRRWTSWTRPAR